MVWYGMVVWCDMVWYGMVSYPILSYDIISYHISYHIISYHIISYHIISYHINIMLCYITCYVISHHSIAYHNFNIKTGHSNLVSCFGSRMRALAKVFYRGEAEVKYRASARIWRFEWPVSILIMTWYPVLLFKTVWFCRSRQCTPSPLWMHRPVAKARRLMTSQYRINDGMDNLNPQWMQVVNR